MHLTFFSPLCLAFHHSHFCPFFRQLPFFLLSVFNGKTSGILFMKLFAKCLHKSGSPSLCIYINKMLVYMNVALSARKESTNCLEMSLFDKDNNILSGFVSLLMRVMPPICYSYSCLGRWPANLNSASVSNTESI